MDYHVLCAIFALIVIDYVSGAIKAILCKTFSSTRMREGLAHKGTYAVAIILCMIIEYLSGYLELGYVYASGITALTCVWIAITEVGSILENLVEINPELKSNSFMKLFANEKEE